MLKTVSLAMTQQTMDHAATEISITLAKLLAGRLNSYFIRPDPRHAVPFVGEGLTAETIQALTDAAETDGKAAAERAQALIRELSAKHGLTVGEEVLYETLIGGVADHVGRKARVADIAIAPQPTEDMPDAEDMIVDLLFKSGRLMLMVPNEVRQIARHIVIGWNGRAECSRAIGASLPLLSYAERVTVLQIGEIGEERPNLGELEDYLTAFQLNLECHRITDDGSRTAEQIHAHALDIGADTLLIGAYSHARWRELIVGGATQWLLEHSKLPVLMSH